MKTLLRHYREAGEFATWENGGRPAPPPHIVKQRAIRECGDRFGCRVLVETGTFLGDMVEAQRTHFGEVYSIELGQDLYERAVRRFRRDRNVHLLQGDSGEVLKQLVPQLTEPTLFWLDGHYSGGITALGDKVSPVLAELTTILSEENKLAHVILVDDARLFVGGEGGYPTIAEVTDHVASLRPEYTMERRDDALRFYPPAR